ncbi:MAG: type II toxin-antitoxin system HicB family antitoxin [Verrucomicrobiae bacterium]|nr:type II toxin-antitoxin system HicB family antitoxin [Verrucomicrobiae bacterium]
MKKLTCVIRRDGPGYSGICAEVPGANGQGETFEECVKNLKEAIVLMLDFYRKKAIRTAPKRSRKVLVEI